MIKKYIPRTQVQIGTGSGEPGGTCHCWGPVTSGCLYLLGTGWLCSSRALGFGHCAGPTLRMGAWLPPGHAAFGSSMACSAVGTLVPLVPPQLLPGCGVVQCVHSPHAISLLYPVSDFPARTQALASKHNKHTHMRARTHTHTHTPKNMI